MASVKSFKDLIVWQEGHKLALLVYVSTSQFPKEEIFALTSQMRRAAVSITSNIAEGFGRRQTKDKEHFYVMSRGSLDELISQIQLAFDLHYIDETIYEKLNAQSESAARLLNALLKAHKNF